MLNKTKINNKVSLIAYLIANGISVPHYCYHNDLPIAGNCRICLVELKNSIKPIVSCATNAKAALYNNNMYHDSALIKKARENILEFLLLNHPLDCPICDQGGDCDLQDQSLFFGFTKRRFYKFKRVVSDKDLGPIVKTVMTRCIHCTRCVRFATEIAGVEELGIFGRGGQSEVGTYVDRVLSSELSGNVIDLCPVGALTLKSFPFELRGWDIEKFESIDPTDGFGSDTRVYISNNQVVQIEPDYNTHTFNTWLTDKGRQFFDGIFDTWGIKKIESNNSNTKDSWLKILKTITKTIYFFDHCQTQHRKNYFFVIVFENLSLEVLSLLVTISQNYSFIRLKRSEDVEIKNDLESDFQLNLATNKVKLNSSTLCLLISNNPRYEGYYLNLNLRQRMLKGNFKCLIIGSLINLTFPISFLGSNLEIVKTITEGNNLTCQDIKLAKNPLIIFNNELFKRNDGKNSAEMIKILNQANIFNKTWNGLNVINPALSESGTNSLAKFSPLTSHDLINFSSIYFLNTTINNVTNLKRITESKLLNFSFNQNKELNINKLFLDQNSSVDQNLMSYNQKHLTGDQKHQKYFYLPTSMFYENNETFISTEGLIKRTTKLVVQKNTKNNWQILRKIFKGLKKNLISVNKKDNDLIFLSTTRIANFKNFISFQYQATQNLTNLGFYLSTKNQSFILHKKTSTYKQNPMKVFNTKMKYWLDDFFSGGKDGYSQNSLILTNCSKILRTESSNFF